MIFIMNHDFHIKRDSKERLGTMAFANEEHRKQEKINGIIYDMSPSPGFRHGIVNGNIFASVKAGLKNSLCLAFKGIRKPGRAFPVQPHLPPFFPGRAAGVLSLFKTFDRSSRAPALRSNRLYKLILRFPDPKLRHRQKNGEKPHPRFLHPIHCRFY